MAAYEFLRFDAADIHIDQDRFQHMPRSARVTFEAIVRAGPLSLPSLLQATALPSRTLRFALRRLCQEELIDGRRNLKDARTVSYFIHRRRIVPDALEAARARAVRSATRGHLIELLGPAGPTPAREAVRPARPLAASAAALRDPPARPAPGGPQGVVPTG